MLVFPIKNAGFPMKNAGFPIKNGAFPIKNGGFPAIYPSNMVVFPIKNAGFPIKNAGFPHQKCWFSSDLPIKHAGFPAVFGMSCRTLSDRRFFFPQNPAHCPTHRSMLPEVSLLWYLCSRVLLEISDRCVFGW